MLRACSHLVVASADVPRIVRFFEALFGLPPKFENAQFAEFVLPSGFRLAFFVPVGASAKHFRADGDRGQLSIGLTVDDVDALHARAESLGAQTAGPPKDHPWGERSFLLVDPDGNRWEVAQSPGGAGMLVER